MQFVQRHYRMHDGERQQE